VAEAKKLCRSGEGSRSYGVTLRELLDYEKVNMRDRGEALLGDDISKREGPTRSKSNKGLGAWGAHWGYRKNRGWTVGDNPRVFRD